MTHEQPGKPGRTLCRVRDYLANHLLRGWVGRGTSCRSGFSRELLACPHRNDKLAAKPAPARSNASRPLPRPAPRPCAPRRPFIGMRPNGTPTSVYPTLPKIGDGGVHPPLPPPSPSIFTP